MQRCRIHMTGASGSGVTTLGRALADRLASSHFDTDDFYWLPAMPPYGSERPFADRVRLMRELFLDRSDWVLSGALESWGAPIAPYVTRVVFVETPTEVRLQRSRAREARHFGDEAVKPAGWRYAACEDFIAWASHDEDGTREGRSRARHEAWLATLVCPVDRVDGTSDPTRLVSELVSRLMR
jgi:adenylate kinase family enzyme